MQKKNKCPRCKSSRLAQRLNGEIYCERCGQRWAKHGLLIPSFDRRNLTQDEEFPEDKQLTITL